MLRNSIDTCVNNKFVMAPSLNSTNKLVNIQNISGIRLTYDTKNKYPKRRLFDR